MSRQGPMLQVKQVTRTFPVGQSLLGKARNKVHALDKVSLELKRGETLGLVGESGCGKSTLAKLLVALDRPTGGEILFEGRPLDKVSGKDLRECRKRIQMVFQDPFASLNPRMTARASIAEPLRNFTALNKDEIEKRIVELANQVGLSSHHLDRFPHELSGGQCQRVGIARAIACKPDVIVADEPVSALDVSIQAQILNLLFEIKSDMDLSIVFVSHDLSVVAHVADRVAVMYLGRILEMGPANDLFKNPRHPYTQMLLGALPHPKPEARRRKSVVRGELPSPLNPPPGCHFRMRCPLAGDDCAKDIPEMERADAKDHMVACHRLVETSAFGEDSE